MQTNDANGYPDGIVLLRIIYKWYYWILLLVVIAGAAAVFFTLPIFIPPYYKSEVVFYPPGTNSSKILIERDPRFGADKEIDEQIQIIKSGIVRDSIIRRYHLIKHYHIDTLESDWSYNLYRQFEENVTVERTQYNSISVKVYDTDAVMAKEIAGDIIKTGDAVKSSIIKENLQLAFNSISKEYFNKWIETDKIVETINSFIDSPISLHVTEKDKPYAQMLKEQLDIQAAIEKARKHGRVKDLEALYNYQLKFQQLNEIQTSYFQAYKSLNSAIPSCYIITPAEVSYKKAGPMRILIVTIAIAASAIFGIFLALAIEKFKALRTVITRS